MERLTDSLRVRRVLKGPQGATEELWEEIYIYMCIKEEEISVKIRAIRKTQLMENLLISSTAVVFSNVC